MDLQVIDNFLPQNQFNHLQELLTGPWFPWFYQNHIAYKGKEDGGYQFVHNFLKDTIPQEVAEQHNPYYRIIQPFEKLGKMIRIKANMRTRTLFHRRSHYHIDHPDVTTAIFYLNTCNGYTKFRKSGKKIKTVANRMVIFDSNLEHAAFSQTDEKARVVINFNYEKF